jgi:hypothetical protein
MKRQVRRPSSLLYCFQYIDVSMGQVVGELLEPSTELNPSGSDFGVGIV